MVVMALDHTRDYFHNTAFIFDPTDPELSNPALFFTRWISHFCAPAFCFLAGISAFLVGRKYTNPQLSAFLLKRGLWLVFVEIIIVNFGWNFDIRFNFFALQVIWSLGICMIFLAALIHLPPRQILFLSLAIILGHNLLDYVPIKENIFWSIFHQRETFSLPNDRSIIIAYPIIPWIGVMSLGYYFGAWYNKKVEARQRRKLFNAVGLGLIGAFVVIRGMNQYGNLKPWSGYDDLWPTVFSFMDPAKYPPSLSYLLMTLGPVFLFLANTENWKGRLTPIFSVFGKVPFFYYIIHIYVIHLAAMVLAEATGFGWRSLILVGGWRKNFPALNSEGYGEDLWFTYVVWICIVALLYPLCKKFSKYKMQHKEKAWLSYL